VFRQYALQAPVNLRLAGLPLAFRQTFKLRLNVLQDGKAEAQERSTTSPPRGSRSRSVARVCRMQLSSRSSLSPKCRQNVDRATPARARISFTTIAS
jgi:hypothetical protein